VGVRGVIGVVAVAVVGVRGVIGVGVWVGVVCLRAVHVRGGSVARNSLILGPTTATESVTSTSGPLGNRTSHSLEGTPAEMASWARR
jgi:hypothetical protein